jgi:hypothetical protein
LGRIKAHEELVENSRVIGGVVVKELFVKDVRDYIAAKRIG